MDRNAQLAERLSAIDVRIRALESDIAREGAESNLEAVLIQATHCIKDLLTAYAHHAGKPVPETDDPLEVFRAFVKGDPSLNAVRDNVRELVYYRNCLDMDRADALPARPERMAVRTARHVYLYLYTRCTQEGRLS